MLFRTKAEYPKSCQQFTIEYYRGLSLCYIWKAIKLKLLNSVLTNIHHPIGQSSYEAKSLDFFYPIVVLVRCKNLRKIKLLRELGLYIGKGSFERKIMTRCHERKVKNQDLAFDYDLCHVC